MNEKWQKQDSARRNDLSKYSIFSKMFLELLEAPWKHPMSFPVVDGPQERQPLWNQLPLIYSDSGSVISVVLLGRKWKHDEHSFHFFFTSCSKSCRTPQISYWTWPRGQVAIPHLQQAGGGWVAPLAAHPGSSTPLLALRCCLQSDSSCSGLSPTARFVISVTLWHTHTHSSCQWPRGPGILFSLSSVLLHTGLLHCSLLPAIGSDLFLSTLKHPAVEHQWHADICPVWWCLSPAFKLPLQSPFGISGLGFCYFLNGGGCLWYQDFNFFYSEGSKDALAHFRYIWIIAKKKMKKSGLYSAK